MGELSAATDSISPSIALLWPFYPFAVVVLLELFLRAMDGDDDDDSPGGGTRVRVSEPMPVPVPS